MPQMAHIYLFFGGCVFITSFLIYVFICKHKIRVKQDSSWSSVLRKVLPYNIVEGISHDSHVWYYKDDSLCVGYGEYSNQKCNSSEVYCAGGDYVGSPALQATAIKNAIKNVVHSHCPLIYPSAK